MWFVPAVLAALCAVAASSTFVDPVLSQLGIPNPGPLTTLGIPAIRAASWVMAAYCVGSFLVPLLLPREAHTSPGLGLNPQARALVRSGGATGLLLGLVALTQVPWNLSDVSGMPLSETLRPSNWRLALTEISESRVWLLVAVIALASGACALRASRWRAVPFLLAGAALAVVPRALAGHSASGGNHDIASDFYLLHVLAAVAWCGGLAAILLYGTQRGAGANRALASFSKLAFCCVVVMAVTGAGNAVLRVPLDTLVNTSYGALVLAKVAMLVLLAGIGYLHRRNIGTGPRLQDDAERTTFARLAGTELVVMAATFAVAVSMGRTPPPPITRDVSYTAVSVGYDVTVAPVWPDILAAWRPDVVSLVLAATLAVAYRAYATAPRPRAAAFYAGCSLLALTMSGPVGYYMPAMFSYHMLGLVILGLVIPLFVVAGRPVQALEPRFGEYIRQLRCAPWVAALTHPFAATVIFLVVFYTSFVVPPLYELMVAGHGLMVFMSFGSLAAGANFFASVLHPKHPWPVRAGAFALGLVGHALFYAYLTHVDFTLGGAFYRRLSLPWALDLARDQEVYGVAAWLTAAVPLAVAAALLARQAASPKAATLES